MTDWSVKEESMSAIIVDKKEKQKNIVRSAMKIFSQKGFDRTTVSDIAQEAGIGKGTYYEYFKSKDEVIHLVFDYFMQDLVPDFQKIVQQSIPASEKIILMIKSMSHLIESKEQQDFVGLVFDVWAEGIRSQPHRKSLELKMKQFYKDYREPVVEVLKQGIRSGEFRSDIKMEAEASVLIGLLDGLLVQWVLDRKGFPIQSALDAVVETLLRGILSQDKKNKNKDKKALQRRLK